MRTSSLVVGLTAVFAGLTAVIVVLGFVFELGLLVLAVPFGAATYGFWYHASGRLDERVRRERRGARGRTARGRTRRGDGDGTRGGVGAGPREAWTGPRGGERGFAGAGPSGRDGNRTGRGVAVARSGPSVAEACRVLGIDRDADGTAIKRAYRRRVKDVHPDTDGGDEQAFKRVNEAYRRLAD